jgi:hypothetical protein
MRPLLVFIHVVEDLKSDCGECQPWIGIVIIIIRAIAPIERTIRTNYNDIAITMPTVGWHSTHWPTMNDIRPRTPSPIIPMPLIIPAMIRFVLMMIRFVLRLMGFVLGIRLIRKPTHSK